MFTKRFLYASNSKSDGYKLLPLREALKCHFIEFNANAVYTISVDIDNCDLYELKDKLEKVPTPSIIVETDNGFHLHYKLTFPISYRKQSTIKWAKNIQHFLTTKVEGDVNALGLRRMYRNPDTHTAWYNDVTYTLDEFNVPYNYRPVTLKRKYRNEEEYDFTTIGKGNRHMSLFNYLRVEAYKLNGNDNLEEVLTFIAKEANFQMTCPLPDKEIDSIVKSIVNFMLTKYTGRINQTEFNRFLARKKHERTIQSILLVLKYMSLKHIQMWSNRYIAKTCGVSPSTISLHKDKILEILINYTLANIKMSMEEYLTMVYEFVCNEKDCKNKGKVVEIGIPLATYDTKKKYTLCKSCGKAMDRHYSISGHQTFNDGYKG